MAEKGVDRPLTGQLFAGHFEFAGEAMPRKCFLRRVVKGFCKVDTKCKVNCYIWYPLLALSSGPCWVMVSGI